MYESELLVAVDLTADDAGARASKEAALAGRGLNVTAASDSPDNATLLLHKTTGPSASALARDVVEIGQIGANLGSTKSWAYRQDMVSPYLESGSGQPNSRQLYRMLAGSTDASEEIRKILLPMPDFSDTPIARSLVYPGYPSSPGNIFLGALGARGQDVQGKETVSDENPVPAPSSSPPVSAHNDTGDSLNAQVSGASTDGAPRPQPDAWPMLPDRLLFESLQQTEQRSLAASILRARYGIQSEAAGIQSELTHLQIALVRVETAEELRKSIAQWRSLARIAPWFMAFTLLIALGLLVGSVLLTKWGSLDGYQLSGVIFMSAVFVISPATLLLLERPLRGVDAAAAPKTSADTTA